MIDKDVLYKRLREIAMEHIKEFYQEKTLSASEFVKGVNFATSISIPADEVNMVHLVGAKANSLALDLEDDKIIATIDNFINALGEAALLTGGEIDELDAVSTLIRDKKNSLYYIASASDIYDSLERWHPNVATVIDDIAEELKNLINNSSSMSR